MSDDSARVIPPIPYNIPIVDSSGRVTVAWSKFFRQIFIRVGENIALSNVELENLENENLEDIESDIAALQLLTTSQGNAITALQSDINGLNQEPVA